MKSFTHLLIIYLFKIFSHFEIDRASFNFTPWKGIDKNSASIDFLQEKKKKKKGNELKSAKIPCPSVNFFQFRLSVSLRIDGTIRHRIG